MSNVQSFTDGTTTLKDIVKKAVWQGKRPRTDYWLLFELAVDAYRYMNLHVVNNGKEWKKLTPDATMHTIDFPADFEDFIGVYVPIGGQLYPLTRDDSMVMTTSMNGIYETVNPASGEGVALKSNITPTPSSPGGVNLQGYYNIDWNNQRIFINGTDGEVVLLYKCSGIRVTETTHVLNKYVPYMTAWMLYEFCKYDNEYAISRQQQNLFILNATRIDLAQLESPTLDEYLDAIRSTIYGTAKR